MKKNQKVLFDLATELRKYFQLQAFEPIIPWAKKNINFSSDVSAQRNFLDFDLYPYQIDPIKTWEDLDHIKEVVVCSPEQMRLSTLRGVILEKRIAT